MLSWAHRVARPAEGSIAKSRAGFVLAVEGRVAWNIHGGMSEPAASVHVLSRGPILRAFPALVGEGPSALPSRNVFVSERTLSLA